MVGTHGCGTSGGPPRAGPDLVGAIGERVLIVTTDYLSRSNGGSHRCGAETWTELCVPVTRPLRRTFRRRIVGCWTGIELEADWHVRARRLAIGPPPGGDHAAGSGADGRR